MVKRGPWLRPQASEGEAQHGPFCWIGRIGQGDKCLHCGWHGQDREGIKGSKRARRSAAGSGEPGLPFQADRTGGRAAVAMAFQCACRSRLACDLCRDAAHAGGSEGADQQDGSQRCARYGPDDAGGAYRPVHVKTLRSQKLRMLLTHRKLLQSKAIAIENDLRGTLRNFGVKVGVAWAAKFEPRLKEWVV